MKLEYVITGTGRCGTVYAARVLTSVGIPCGHEVFFDYRGMEVTLARLEGRLPLELSPTSRMKVLSLENTEAVDPYIMDLKVLKAESSYMAAPFLQEPCLQEASVIHLVRNPINVINSFVNALTYFKEAYPTTKYAQKYEQFIIENVPELSRDMTAYDRAALYWIRWNKMIESNSLGKKYVRFRAEEGPLPIIQWLNLPINLPVYDDRTINSYKKQGENFSLDELNDFYIKDELISLAKSYGYNMNSQKILL